MKFKEYLLEIFDKPLPFGISDEAPDLTEYEFKAGDLKYAVSFLNHSELNEKDCQHVYSTLIQRKVIGPDVKDFNLIELYFSEGPMGNTAKHVKDDYDLSFKVFSTVAAITQKYLKENKPNIFFFSSKIKEESRLKLYDVLSKKMEHVTDYKSINNSDAIHAVSAQLSYISSSTSAKFYVFVRKNLILH